MADKGPKPPNIEPPKIVPGKEAARSIGIDTAFIDGLAAGLGLFLLMVLFLGVLHVCRILGRCLILLIREVKHELTALWDVVRDLAKEFSRWKSDP